MAADGSIIIDTAIDTRGAKVGFDKVQQMANKLCSTVRNIGNNMLQSARNAMSLNATANSYERAAAGATQAAKSVKEYDAALARNQRKIDAVKAKLSDYFKSVEETRASTDAALKQTSTDDQAARLLEIEQNELQNLNDKYAVQLNLLSSLEAEQQRLAAARSQANSGSGDDMPPTPNEESISVWSRLGSAIKSATGAVLGAAFGVAASALRRLGGAAKRAVLHLAQMAGHTVVNGMKRLGSFTLRAAKAIFTLGKSAKKSNGGMKSSFMTILKYGLGIRSLYALLNKLRTAIKEGFGNLAQYSDKTNKSISSVISALSQFKNALAAAFAPVVDTAAPAVANLIQLLTTAVEKIGQLIAALTGQKTFLRAKEVQKDYADSLKETAEEAKEASKQLAGFDDLDILKDDSPKDEEEKKNSPGDMFEEVPVEEGPADIAEKIKDAFEDEDFTDIGRTIGEKLKDALQRIPWDQIKETAYKLGKSLATLLNGILETPGLFYELGRTLAEAINTVFSFLDGFAWNFHWASLGNALMDMIEGACDHLDWTLINHALQGIASGLADLFNAIFGRREVFEKAGATLGKALNAIVDSALTFFRKADFSQAGSTIAAGLNSMIETINWSNLGALFAEYINAFVNLIYGAVSTFDWKAAASALAEGINSAIETIDWAKVGQTFSDAVKGLLQFLVTLIEEIDWYQLGKGVADAIANVDWEGIVELIAEGIGAALGGLGAFIWGLIEDAWNGVIEWWHEVAFEDGQFTIEGLLEGIWEAIENIGTWVKEHIVDPFVEGFKKAFGIHSPSTVMMELGGYLIEGLLLGILSAIKNIGKWIKENVLDPIMAAFNGVKTFFADPIGTVKLAIDKSWEAVVKSWNTVKDSTAVKTIKGKIKQTYTKAKNAFEQLVNSDVLKTVKGLIDNAFVSAKSTFDAFKNGEVFKWVKAAVDDSFAAAEHLFGSIKDSTVFKTIKGAVDQSFNSIRRAFDAIRNSEAVKTVKGVVTSAFTVAKIAFDAFKDADAFKVAKGIISGAFSTTKATFDAFKDADVIKTVQGAINGTFNTAKATFDAFKNADVIKTVKGVVDSAFTTAKNVFDSFKDGEIFKTVQGRIAASFTSARDTFHAFIDGNVTKTVLGIIDNTFTTVKNTFNALKNADAVKTIKGAVDNAFTTVKNTFDALRSETITKVVQATVSKIGSWVADAWTAANMASSTVTRAVQATISKIGSWASDTWTAATMTAGTVTRTVESVVKKASNWVTDAWTAAKTTTGTVTRTVEAAVKKAASWVVDAWTAVNMATGTITKTVSIALQKAYTWVSDAWTVVSLGTGTITKTVSIALQKAYTWAADAWEAAKMAASSIAKSIVVSVTKGSWVSEAFTAAQTLGGTIRKTLQISISWIGDKLQEAWKVITGRAKGGVLTLNGQWRDIPQFASGGRIMRNGRASWWDNVQKYAAGTSRAHGSMFVAGEAGPEVVGHINGRTEVLNKSQIASAIYSAVLAGMEAAVNGLGRYLSQRLADCANAIITAILSAGSIPLPLPVSLELNKIGGDRATLAGKLEALSNVGFSAPTFSTGTVMPYEVRAEIQRSTNKITDAIDEAAAEIIGSNISALGSLGAMIVAAIKENGMGNAHFDTSSAVQNTIDEINRRTQMFNSSPLKG